jgi:hypothetical protein
MFVQGNKSSDESRVSKKNLPKEIDNSAFEHYASQCKVKADPIPKGPLASEVALGGSLPDTEPAIQMKSDEEEPLQGKGNIQLAKGPEEEELPVQGKGNIQLASAEKNESKPNNTGLPDKLKDGIETLSGYSMGDVKVHYNSPKPAQLQALAYTQGADIHVAPSQEQYLPHEAWHAVQQKQGRVQPTAQMKENVSVNDDKGLEQEADIMGSKAKQLKTNQSSTMHVSNGISNHVLQRMVGVAKSALTGDLIESNSIKYALDRAGDPAGLLKDLDFSTIPDGGSLYIVGHGSITESGEYNAGQILGFLLDPKKGLRKDSTNLKIVFTSCHAGQGDKDPKTDSLTAKVTDGLKKAGLKNITVFGARGLSLKSSGTGDDFTVIDPAKEKKYNELQKAMLLKHQPKEQYALWLTSNPSASLEERGSKADEISRIFYFDLISSAESAGFALPNQQAMSVHKIADNGKTYYKMRNMAESPFMDIEDYGSPWEGLK